MRQKQGTSLMLLFLYSLLIVALLVLVLAGARLYNAAVNAKTLGAAQRSALSFIQTQAAGADTVSLGDGPEGQMLRLAERGSGYETRIFLSGSGLRTDFCAVNAPAAADSGEQVCPLEQLQLQWESESLLRIEADGKTAWICCNGGGDHG